MTAMIVLEKADLNDVVKVSRRAADTAPARIGLKEGDSLTIETLLYAAVLKSANDAAVALAEAIAGSEEEFVKLMNRKAAALGAHDTKFINANGLPGKGQHITAHDLSKIMRKAIEYPVLKRILGTRVAELPIESGRAVMIRNTNMLLWSDENVIGGKTGYTRRAGHCFVCAAAREDAVIVVSLLGAPSRNSLWEEAEALVAFGNKVLKHEEEAVIYRMAESGDAADRVALAKAVPLKRIARKKKVGRVELRGASSSFIK
jgi:D-alanyl-D-alanine carboxypeptidase (penicillin-binding protein 5/6)